MADLHTRHEAVGMSLATLCYYQQKDITRIYLAALTQAGQKGLRRKVAKCVNKATGDKLRLEGEKLQGGYEVTSYTDRTVVTEK